MADRRSRRRNRLLVLLAGVAVLGAVGVAGKFALEWRRDRRAAEALARGMEAYRAGDYNRALPDLGRAISRHRDDPELLYAAADARRRVPEVNDRHILGAINFAKAARDAAPSDPRPRLLLIELYRETRFVTELLAETEAVLASDPENTAALRGRVGALAGLGRRDEAIAAARALLASSSADIESLRILISVLDSSSASVEDLRTELAAHASRFSGDPRFAILEAGVALRGLDEATAIERANHAVAMDLSDPATLIEVVAFCDVLAGQDLALFAKSAAAIDAALKNPDSARQIATFVLGRDWRLLQLASAQEHIRAISPTDEQTPTAAIGWAAFLLRDIDDKAFTDALLARPAAPEREAWIATLEAYDALSSGDLAAARLAIDRVQAAQEASASPEPLAPPAEIAAARLLMAAGDTAAARSTLLRLGRDRDWLIARAELLQLLLDRSEITDARDLLIADPLLASATAVPAAFAASAASLIASRRVGPEVASELLALIERIAEADDQNVDLKVFHAIALLGAQRTAEGQAILAALGDAPLSDRARILLAAVSPSGSPTAIDVDSLMANPPADPASLLDAALIVAGVADSATGLELFEHAADRAADPLQRLSIQIARAVYMDRVADPNAQQALTTLAADNPDSLPAQLALLESRAGWSSPEGVEQAVIRLRAIAGPNAASWRIFEARRLLRFEEGDAATALALQLLDEARETSWPNPTISDLLADAALRDPDQAAGRTRAIRHLVEGVQYSREAAVLYPRLVLLLRAEADAPEAERQLDALLAQDMISPALRLARADLALFLGRNEEALRDYRFLAASGGERVRLGEANALLGLGSWNEAEAIYEELARAESPSVPVIIDYANALAFYGYFDRAVDLLARLPDTVNDQPRTLVIADFYARHAPAEQVDAMLRRMADGGDAAVAGRLAQYLLEAGRTQDALSTAESYLQRFPESDRLREVRALARMSLGRADASSTEDIAELARIAQEREPDSSYAQLTAIMLERAEAQISDPQYVSRVQTLIRREPTFLPAYSALVEFYRLAGQPADAARFAVRASDAVPDNAKAAEFAARALAQAGEFAQAEEYIRRWKSLNRTPTPDPDVLSAALALAQGHAQPARLAVAGWLDQLRSQARETGANRPVLAAILAVNGRMADALALFPEGPLSDQDAADYFGAGVLMLPSSAEVATAWELGALDRAVDDQSRLFVATRLFSLGTENSHAPALAASMQILQALEEAGKGTAETAAMRAGIHASQDQPAEAIAAYRQAIDRNPQDLLAMNNLSVLLSKSPATAPDAVTLAQRALDLGEQLSLPPQVLANVLDTLGVAYLAAGDPAAAVAAFRRGTELDPAAAGCQVGIAEALLAQDDKTEARRALGRVNLANAEADPEVNARLVRVRTGLQ